MASEMKNRKNYKKHLRLAPAYLLVMLWTIFTFTVIGWIILASFSTTREIFSGKLLHSGFHFRNYYTTFIRNKGLLSLLNSIIYTLPSCLLTIVVSAPCAYCLGRYTFKLRGIMEKTILICLSIPIIMLVIPLFSLANQWKVSGLRLTLIVIYTATAIPYTTFFLEAFFHSISHTFEEAATIDGCGPIRCFWSIMFPLAQPGLVTITIFNFIRFWNEYFTALVFANKPKTRPLGVQLYQTVSSMMTSGDWAGMFTSVVIVFVPTVAVYAFLSDKIISGVTAGGVKE